MNDDVISLAWIGACLILVVSALVSRRLGGGAWVRMVAVWVAIIGTVWLILLIAGRLFPHVDFT